MMKKINVLGIVIAVLCFFACTKHESNQAGGTLPAQGAPAAAEKSEPLSSGGIPVRILPEKPTVMTDLQAVFTCSGSVTFEWRKNNQVLVAETTGWLMKKQFVKGDEVAVTVKC